MQMHTTAAGEHSSGSQYGRLVIMTVVSFIAMYWLMYAMVDRVENVYMSLNQVYMAALMTAPMVLIELALMTKHCCRPTG